MIWTLINAIFLDILLVFLVFNLTTGINFVKRFLEFWTSDF